jgi:hypothetical protein
VNVDLLLKRLSKMGMPKDFTEILAGWLICGIEWSLFGLWMEYFLVNEGTVQAPRDLTLVQFCSTCVSDYYWKL